MTWYKDQIPISNAGPYVIERPAQGRSILTIDQLTKADSGLYTCMARNSVGASARNFTLDVTGDEPSAEIAANNDLPGDFSGHADHLVLHNGPQNTTVEQGDKAVLECKVQSLAVPNIKWLKKVEAREYDQVGFQNKEFTKNSRFHKCCNPLKGSRGFRGTFSGKSGIFTHFPLPG